MTESILANTRSLLARALREPLVQFFILGAALFALYAAVSRQGFTTNNTITVSSGQVANLREQFVRLWQREPAPQELQGLIDNWVREEVFYREGLAMGLDRDDPVVRRRIEQKVAFIADTGPTRAPSTAELQQWLDTHADNYRLAPTYFVQQVYFDPAKHGTTLPDDIERARKALESGQPVDGDVTMLPREIRGDSDEIARAFGRNFAGALDAIPVGEWRGLASGFGMHLVRIAARQPGRTPTLAEVLDAVERDLLHARSAQADQAYYEALLKRYTVQVQRG